MLNKKLFIFDLDGTLYLDGKLFQGVSEMLSQLKAAHKDVVFLTNNSSRSTKDYLLKLKKIGIDATQHQMLTSTQTAISYIKTHYPEHAFYVMGTQSMIEEVKSSGVIVASNTQNEHDVSGVLMGYDNELTYEKLITVSRLLLREIPYIATNPDFVCPVDFGYVPDCGSFALMLEKATHKMPRFMGKPNPEIIYEALRRFQVKPEDAIMIGDRLYTDVQCGINAGIDTALVLSGESTLETLQQSKIRPTYVWNTVNDLLK